MTKYVKMIDNLNNPTSDEKYCVLYCIALDWYKFGTKDFVCNLHHRLCNYMGYNFLDLSKGQKSYITHLSNVLKNPHYFYYFVKKWVMPLDYVKFVSGCQEYKNKKGM